MALRFPSQRYTHTSVIVFHIFIWLSSRHLLMLEVATWIENCSYRQADCGEPERPHRQVPVRNRGGPDLQLHLHNSPVPLWFCNY